MSARDALSKMQAGADLVQIYTGLIYAARRWWTSGAGVRRRRARA